MIKRLQARVTEAEGGGREDDCSGGGGGSRRRRRKRRRRKRISRTFSKVRSMPPGELPQDIQLHTVNVHVCGILLPHPPPVPATLKRWGLSRKPMLCLRSKPIKQGELRTKISKVSRIVNSHSVVGFHRKLTLQKFHP